jgi:hypothetical protein
MAITVINAMSILMDFSCQKCNVLKIPVNNKTHVNNHAYNFIGLITLPEHQLFLNITMLALCVVTPCERVGIYDRFGGTYCPHLQSWNSLQLCRWRQYVPPKRLYIPTRLYDVTTHKTNIEIFTTVRTSNIIFLNMLIWIVCVSWSNRQFKIWWILTAITDHSDLRFSVRPWFWHNPRSWRVVVVLTVNNLEDLFLVTLIEYVGMKAAHVTNTGLLTK